MGGGKNSSSSPPDDHSSLDEDDSHCSSDGLGLELGDQSVNPSGFESGDPFYEMGSHSSSNLVGSHENLRRRIAHGAYIINSYKDSSPRIESLNEAKRTLLSYTPGSWIDKEEGENLSDFDAPKTTTLLLVGFKGSGKSSLINRISRVFEDDKLALDRAQVSYCSSSGHGTYFLQAYMIPKRSSSFCLFDTRSLSDEVHDNDGLIKSWMTNGVRSGELVIRDSDSSSVRTSLQCKIRDGNMLAEPIRKVNFVIFAIDGLSVLRYMNSDKEEDARRAETLARTYNFPYLSFRDDKPVIVVTRGDLLSLEERTKVRIYLSELLGVSPSTQIFDIPESCNPVTELAIVDMLRYALEHADKNLPRTSWKCRNLSPVKSALGQIFKSYFIALIFLGLALGMNVAMEGRLPLVHRAPWLTSPVDHPHHHREPPVNQTIDHQAQPEFNSTTQPTSLPDYHQENPATTGESNQPDNVEDSNVTTQPDSSQSASDQPTELHHPSMQSTPNQKVTRDPRRPSVRPKSRFAKHKSRDHSPNRPKQNRSHKQNEAAVSEPEISWEARQRLWLVEE